MKVKWEKLLGQLLGVVFAVVLIKLFMAPEYGWWEIIEQMVKGMIGL